MRMKWLLWAAVLLMLAAGVAVFAPFYREMNWFYSQGKVGSMVLEPRHYNMALAGLMLIESPQGQITLERGLHGWTIAELHGYPADEGRLAELLVRYMNTRLAHRVPVRFENLDRMSLLQKVENDWEFEPGRTAIVFTVAHGLNNSHKMMYQVLIGKHRPPRRPGPQAEQGTYVRYPGSNKVYLVAGDMWPELQAHRWLEPDLLPARLGETLSRVMLVHPEAPARVWARSRGQGGWQGPPAGFPLERLPALFTRLRPRTVAPPDAPAEALGRVQVVRYVLSARDGLTYHLTIGLEPGREDLHYVAASAEARPGSAEVLMERAERFNARFASYRVGVRPERARPLLQIAAMGTP